MGTPKMVPLILGNPPNLTVAKTQDLSGALAAGAGHSYRATGSTIPPRRGGLGFRV